MSCQVSSCREVYVGVCCKVLYVLVLGVGLMLGLKLSEKYVAADMVNLLKESNFQC